jgi:hypothetical protein
VALWILFVGAQGTAARDINARIAEVHLSSIRKVLAKATGSFGFADGFLANKSLKT